MTVLRALVALLGLGLLQVFLPRVWAGLGVVDWLLIYVVLQSLRGSFQRSILLGASAGLVQDGLSGGIIGLHAFAKTSVAALIATFGGLLVVRGPFPEAVVTGGAAMVEGLIVIAWQAMLERPVSLGPIDVVVRAVATAAATLAVLSTARWWEQRALRRGRGRR
ncbi:MAG: rod shape-determining protein MreD [Acidobacteriota bacterium]|jgi:rod shape-determining protein MreD